jgi:hypothetical protein
LQTQVASSIADAKYPPGRRRLGNRIALFANICSLKSTGTFAPAAKARPPEPFRLFEAVEGEEDGRAVAAGGRLPRASAPFVSDSQQVQLINDYELTRSKPIVIVAPLKRIEPPSETDPATRL